MLEILRRLRFLVLLAVFAGSAALFAGHASHDVFLIESSLAALLIMALYRQWRRTRIAKADRVELNVCEERIKLHDQTVRWDDLVRITIITTDAVPHTEDLFWTFEDAAGRSCSFPGAAEPELMDWICRLENIDHEALIRAQCCTEPACFRIWCGLPGTGVPNNLNAQPSRA